MKQIESHACFDGTLEIWEHESATLKCPMTFSIFLPPQAQDINHPFITFLSGLTCTHDNFTSKSGAYKMASKLGIAIIAPDTSPRGDNIPDDVNSYDFGKGAGFYINATQSPWDKNYHMEDYITKELNDLVCSEFSLQKNSQSIMGHSMGGHGALTLYLKNPDLYKSVSAFAPIVSPSTTPWGQKAFKGYLGDNVNTWKNNDACCLIEKSTNAPSNSEILIDQGLGDQFLEKELMPELFQHACDKVGQKVRIKMHENYDHSYYFIQSFIDDHINHHAKYLIKN